MESKVDDYIESRLGDGMKIFFSRLPRCSEPGRK